MFLKTICTILFILAFRVYPQGDINQANFFPLQVGDKYQMFLDYSYSMYSIRKFIGWDIPNDTIIDNKKFFRLPFSQAFNHNLFYNYDKSEQKLWVKIPDDDTLRVAIDFLADSGSVYTSYIYESPRTIRSLGNYSKEIQSDTFLTHRVFLLPLFNSFLYMGILRKFRPKLS